MAWLEANQILATTIATIALAAFAGVQIGLEIYRAWDRRRAARIRLRGPAWLARRSLEAMLATAVEQRSAFEWFGTVGTSQSLDPLERHVLSVLRLGSIAGGNEGAAAEEGFERFLAFADRVNALGASPITGKGADGWAQATLGDRRQANDLARAALSHLVGAIDALARIAPRRDNEPALPPDVTMPLLSGAPVPRQQ